VLVIGAGPAGLEFSRVASGQGNSVVVYEREHAVGGHVRAYGALPYRQQYGSMATWLAEQARGNGTEIKLSSPVTRENIDSIVAAEKPDHVVVASGARYRRDGFQGQTGKPIPGWETGKCVSWDDIALDRISLPSGEVLVVDEMADVAAPLTAVKMAKQGARVSLLTRWPMIGMETVPEVYFHWIMTYLHEAKVEIITSHIVRRINGRMAEINNVYEPSRIRDVGAELVVMATARTSEAEIYHILRQRGASVEAIGCAVAPRSVYEATLEGHRAARRLGASQWTRIGRDMTQSHVPQYYNASL
jgi:pyruvate/2-oxoglutarate dehydrogenase complex dihydrolipoamide dehydrogenase (E3) component